MVFPKDYMTYTSTPINDYTSVHLMSLSAFLIGILVLALVVPLQAHPLPHQNLEYKRYCSTSLADVIRLLCGGRTSSQQNAQYPINNNGTFSSSSLNRLANDEGISFKKIQADGLHECCLRPCGYSELNKYCGPV